MPSLRLVSACLAAALFQSTAIAAEEEPAQLPEGPPKAFIEQNCVACHALDRITNARYNPTDWANALDRMVSVGAPVTPDMVPELLAYLTEHFPEEPRPAPVLIDGPAQVTFDEYKVNAPGTAPWDVQPMDDGSIWYTGEYGNLVGHYDPATGQKEEYRVRVPVSQPRNMTVDADGYIWFTANFRSYVGKLDPATGQHEIFYAQNREEAHDPFAIVRAEDGTMWVSYQNTNFIGRLAPGETVFDTFELPTLRSRPYSLAFDPGGDLWFGSNGTNMLGQIDTETLEVTEHRLPGDNARPRSIMIAPDGDIYYTDSGRHALGRFDPETGTWSEWPTPSGEGGTPWGLAWFKGKVWFTEANVSPNALVRFDPSTEEFSSWAIPGRGEDVRNIEVTADGEGLVLPESGVNLLAVVHVTEP